VFRQFWLHCAASGHGLSRKWSTSYLGPNKARSSAATFVSTKSHSLSGTVAGVRPARRMSYHVTATRHNSILMQAHRLSWLSDDTDSLQGGGLHGPGPGPGPGSIRCCIEHFGRSRTFFRKEKSFVLELISCSWHKSDSGNKSHRLDFLGDFHSCPLPEIFRDNTLQTWHPISLYRSSNAKITSHVFTASLNN
jgi:hypothetical protein